MFRNLLAMNNNCPECGHQFMREEGFFQGAMFVSYALGVIEFAFFALLAYVWLGPRIGIPGALLLAIAVHLVLVPQLFQYSRVIWAHLNVYTRGKDTGD